MTKTTRDTILFTVGYVAVGLIAVVAVGGLIFHRQFFHFSEPLLSFLLLGVTGALIYASVQMRGAWSAVLVIALWCIIEVAMNPGSFWSTAAAIAYCLLVGFPVMAAAYVQKSLTRFKFARFIIMGLAVSAGYTLMTLLFVDLAGVGTRLGTVWNQTFLGLKLGAALGLGFELIDLIGRRPERRRRHPVGLLG